MFPTKLLLINIPNLYSSEYFLASKKFNKFVNSIFDHYDKKFTNLYKDCDTDIIAARHNELIIVKYLICHGAKNYENILTAAKTNKNNDIVMYVVK